MRTIPAALLCLATVSAGATLTVSKDGGAEFDEVQAAADAAADGDTVLVFPGEYVLVEPLDFNRLHDPANPASPPVKNLVVRGVGGPAVTILRLAETLLDPARASVAVFEHGEGPASVIEGVTLTGGRGMPRGGGIFCAGASSPSVTDCVISGNSATWGGGVRCTYAGTPIFTRCTIEGNHASSSGGGISVMGGGARFSECLVADNSAAGDGGGVACEIGEALFERCRIEGNTGAQGGGINCFGNSTAEFIGCVVTQNTARWRAGGGVSCAARATPVLRHCTIAGNVGQEEGGGVVCSSESAPVITGCILWDNPCGSFTALEGANPRVTYSCIEGASVVSGQGNIAVNPRFRGWRDAAEVWVDCAASGPGDGSSQSPYRALAAALAFDPGVALDSPCVGSGEGGTTMGAIATPAGTAGMPRRTVWIAAGTYRFQGSTCAHAASLRGMGAALTTLDGTVFGLRSGASLANVTVTGGNAGGVCIPAGESPEVRDCVVTENTAYHFSGGGVYCGTGSEAMFSGVRIVRNGVGSKAAALVCASDSAPTFTACAVLDNEHEGIVCHAGANPTFRGCEISGNARALHAVSAGVAAYEGAVPVLDGCTIADNLGPGVTVSQDGRMTITDCAIVRNAGVGVSVTYGECTVRNSTISGNGGGIAATSAALIAEGCRIAGNTAKSGGGVWCGGPPSPQLRDCLIIDNRAGSGAALQCVQASPVLTNCTIVGNVCDLNAGALECERTSGPYLASCIVWDNGERPVVCDGTSSLNAEYSCLATPDVWPGVGNLNLDPQFCGWGENADVYVDPAAPEPGDGSAAAPFRDAASALTFSLGLSAGSPCLTAGQGGVRIGAETGTCPAGGVPVRRVHLAAGQFAAELVPPAHPVSIQGAGPELTVLEGTVRGLMTGMSLADLTVAEGRKGGVVVPAGASPELRNCVIRHALGTGAIVCGALAAPTIRDCVIEENGTCGIAVADDGGVTCIGCLVRHNRSEGVAGVSCGARSSVTLRDCRVEENGSTANCGGLAAKSSAFVTLERCRIIGNASVNYYPGLAFTRVAGAALTNCCVAANSSSLFDAAGVACIGGGGVRLVNCTVAENNARGLTCRDSATVELLNCIVWNNIDGSAAVEAGSTLSASYSCIKGATVWEGDGNINLDPLFVWPGTYDFQQMYEFVVDGRQYKAPNMIVHAPNLEPRPGSPAIDAGTAAGAPASDLAGRARPFGAGIDMGAYESHGDPGAGGQTLRVPGDFATIQEALDAAADADTVLVLPGEYVLAEPLDFNRFADPDDSPQQPRKNVVLKADEGPAVTVLRAAPRDPDRRGGVIVFNHGEDDRSSVDGFTITGGTNAGIRCERLTSPRVTRCRIAGNGIGIQATEASLQISLCAIEDNAKYGISVSSFTGTWPSSLRMSSCEVRRNGAAGVSLYDAEDCTAEGCTIAGNRGSGILCMGTSSLAVADCCITGNWAEFGGGVRLRDRASVALERCTIAGNVVTVEGGGVRGDPGTSMVVRETIVWGNAGGSLALDVSDADNPARAVVMYSCVDGASVWPGPGNIASDPGFGAWGSGAEMWVNAASPAPGEGTQEHPFAAIESALGYDYALAVASPCMHASEDGGAIGADRGTCASAGSATRVVHVAAGVYPNRGTNLAHGVSLVGAGSDTTVVEGPVIGPTTGARIENLKITNSARSGVVVGAGEDPHLVHCVLAGNSADKGGGIYVGTAAAPTLESCSISANTAFDGGGLWASKNAVVTLDACVVSGNTGGKGGGIRLHASTLLARGSRFAGNAATGDGGGAYVEQGSLTIHEGEATGNSAGRGGGICALGARVTITAAVVARNRAETEGGGILVEVARPLTVSGSSITGNIVRVAKGGGIVARNAEVALDDCLIADNYALDGGGGIYISQMTTLNAARVTIASNSSAAGGAVWSKSSTTVLRNAIMWGNGADGMRGEQSATWDTAFSCIQGNPFPEGQGNIDADPLFCAWGTGAEVYVDAAHQLPGDGSAANPYRELAPALVYDYALRTDSPCIAAGEGGIAMGAARGTCAADSVQTRLVHVGGGTYDVSGLVLRQGVSIRGQGAGRTTLVGPVRGLCSGALLAAVTVTGTSGAGIDIGPGRAPRIESCEIVTTGECGILSTDAAPTIADCVVAHCRTGVRCVGGSPVFLRCEIRGNTERGMAFEGGAGGVLECRVVANPGGGIACSAGAAPTFTDCIVSGNGVQAENGGGFFVSGASPVLENCTVAANFAGVKGGGMFFSGSSAIVRRSTVAHNAADAGGGGIACTGVAPTIVGCIVWGNAGGSLDAAAPPGISYSCLESASAPAGAGNINADPLFCDDGLAADVYVDGANPAHGTGTRDDPFRDISDALGFSYTLAGDSPCRGTGEGGADMGADKGACAGQGGSVRRVIVGAGEYRLDGLSFAGVSFLGGAGAQNTVFQGAMVGFRTGAIVSGVTVAGGGAACLHAGAGEDPTFADCAFVGSAGAGVICGGGSRFEACIVGDNADAGIVCLPNAAPSFSACVIADNAAEGIRADHGRVTLDACEIRGNRSDGLKLSSMEAVLQRCTISDNARIGISVGGTSRCEECTAEENGGAGIQLWSGAAEVVGCKVASNRGGGIVCGSGSAASLSGCVVFRNTNTGRGGGIVVGGCSPAITDCTIAGNYSPYDGGGLYVSDGSPQVANCVFADNLASQGGAVCCTGGVPTFTHCTFTGNAAASQGGAFFINATGVLGASARVLSSIIWENGEPAIAFGEGDAEIGYSCVQAVRGYATPWPGAGNIQADPCFSGWDTRDVVHVDQAAPADGDGSAAAPYADILRGLEYGLALARTSPCVGAGADETTMGADRGICERRGVPMRTVFVAAGTYEGGWIGVGHPARLVGAGREACTIEATLFGLPGRSSVSGVTIAHGVMGAMLLAGEGTQSVNRVTVAGNNGHAHCGVVTCVNCEPRFGNCIFSSNVNSSRGILYGREASAALVNCVFAANEGACALSSSVCEGPVCVPTSTFAFANCTLIDNHGAPADTGTAEFTNCIIWNCIRNGAPVVPAAASLHSCLTDRDPLVESRGVIDFSRVTAIVQYGRTVNVPDFVVEVPDYRLRADSPAVDAGTAGGAPDVDLDDHGRPCGNAVDIGAYERGDCPDLAHGFRRGDANDDGRLNIADAVYTLAFLFARGSPPKCLDAADANDDGRLTIADALGVLTYLFRRAQDLEPPFDRCGRDPSPDPLGCMESANCAGK